MEDKFGDSAYQKGLIYPFGFLGIDPYTIPGLADQDKVQSVKKR